ncbi:DUF4326 domain-containing protein [Cronobacter sakazakii]|nr:DUF4326 domain-containing protein [Cronobacter sakazakii]
MSVLFLEYSKEFNCFGKFKRKLDFLTGNINISEIIFISDSRGFIKKIAEDKQLRTRQVISAEEAEYAVIFRDKRQGLGDFKLNKDSKVKVVLLNLTLVVNKDKGEKFDVYIGRGTIWGNPYQIGVDGDRDEVIRKFKYDFDKGFLKPFDNIEKNFSALKGKVIACHCKPYACHGDIIADYINSLDDGE